jgi:cellulase
MYSAYLVRHEILALHQRGKPQAYPVCFQAQLAGTGTARPTDTAKFPDAYNINDEFKN